jgi:fatty-acid desaturase
MMEINGVKVRSSYSPQERPDFDKWFKKMKISHVSWYENDEAKRKADRIMERVGKNINPKSQLERFISVIMGA